MSFFIWNKSSCTIDTLREKDGSFTKVQGILQQEHFHTNTNQGSSCSLQLWRLAPTRPQTCSSPISSCLTWAVPPQIVSQDSGCRSQAVWSVTGSPWMTSRTHHHHQMWGQSPPSPHLEWIATQETWGTMKVNQSSCSHSIAMPQIYQPSIDYNISLFSGTFGLSLWHLYGMQRLYILHYFLADIWNYLYNSTSHMWRI